MNIIQKARIFFFSLILIIIGSFVALFYIFSNLTDQNIIILFALFVFLIFLIGLLFVSSRYYYRRIFRHIFHNIAFVFAQEKNWSQRDLSEDIKKCDISTLQKFFSLIYPNLYELKYENTLFKGEIGKKSFCLFEFSFIRHGRYYELQPDFVLDISPIDNFNNTIVITPHHLPLRDSKIFSEAYVDEHHLFNIYAQKQKDAAKYITKDFLSTLTEYYNKIGTRMTLLLTPKNTFYIKTKSCSSAFFQYFFFISLISRSANSIEEEIFNEYNQMLDIIEVLNLLKKE